MTESQHLNPKLSAELESIRNWREEREAGCRRDLNQIDEEDNRLHQKLAEIQRKLSENAQLREHVLAQLHQLPIDEGRRSHNVLLDTLGTDHKFVIERSNALRGAFLEQQAALQARLDDPAVSDMIGEYESFKELEPALSNMPPSYRKVALDHHESLRSRLLPLFELAQGTPGPLEQPVVPVGIICSVDPEEGAPTAFAVIVPTDYNTYRDWALQDQGLQTVIGYSLVGSISQVLHRCGAANAPVAFRNYEGCLAIQVWLGNQNVKGDLVEIATEIIESSARLCPDIEAARLVCKAVWVSPFTIAPDEESDMGRADAENTEAEDAAPLEQEEDLEVDEPEESADGESPNKPVRIVLRRGGSDSDD